MTSLLYLPLFLIYKNITNKKDIKKNYAKIVYKLKIMNNITISNKLDK